ncbi:MAG: ABC transporter permease [Bacteroidetes bacterium]|nr:ABC transporter permease [Bacteroidota bacterium]
MNIIVYIIKRILYAIPVFFGVSFLIFIMFNIVAGDPTIMLLGKYATAKQMADLRHYLGLDKAWYLQYFDILKSAFTFNFGHSWATKQLISEMIKSGAKVSLTLSLPSFIISSIISLIISMISAFYRGKWIDKFLVLICVIMMSISALSYILFGQWILAYKFGLFPIEGYEYGFPFFIPYIILPCIIWIILSTGSDIRFYRTIILDELYQDYVRTARAKGLSETMIFCKHILKNAMIPIITNLIIQIPFLILGFLLIENFFGIPGLGSIILDAINNSDFPVIKAITILTASVYIVFNAITDILYVILDPRINLK